MPADDSETFGGYRLDGTYIFGPAGMRCVLAVLIADSLIRHFGRTAYGERRALIRERADHMRANYSDDELREMEAERRKPLSGYGLYGRPRKPANSGRKRKAA